MEVGGYYFSKVQSLSLVLLIMGTVIGLVLVQRQQTIKTRAAMSDSYRIYENYENREPQLVTFQGTYPIKTFDVTIESTGFENRPRSPIEAKVTLPAPKVQPKVGSSVGYYIPFRNSSVRVINPDAVKKRILNSFPNAKIGNWDTIVSQSVANGWNPAFVLTLWVEESGAQGYPGYSDGLGCDPSHPSTDINKSLNCLFQSFGTYSADRFEDFMCVYGGDGFHKAPCTFNVSNPNFPRNVGSIYSELVPSGLGSIVK